MFDNKHYYHPAVGDGRRFKALTDHLMDFTEDTSTLLDGFLHRPIDYSARTRVVLGDTKDIDTALLPECLAWDLFRLILLRRLGPLHTLLRQASEEIDERSDRAREALLELSLKTIILAAFDFTRYRVVALRPIITGERALIVNKDLLNYVGWENLGRRVRLFSIMSAEAEQEGINKLLPSWLKENGPTVKSLRKLKQQKRSSVFFIKKQHLVRELARRAVNEESSRLGGYDLFTIGINTFAFEEAV